MDQFTANRDKRIYELSRKPQNELLAYIAVLMEIRGFEMRALGQELQTIRKLIEKLEGKVAH